MAALNHCATQQVVECESSGISSTPCPATCVNLLVTCMLIGVLIYTYLRRAVRTNDRQAIKRGVYAFCLYGLISTWIMHIAMFVIFTKYVRNSQDFTSHLLYPDCTICRDFKEMLLGPCPSEGECSPHDTRLSGWHAHSYFYHLAILFMELKRTRRKSVAWEVVKLGLAQDLLTLVLLLLSGTALLEGTTRDICLLCLGLSMYFLVEGPLGAGFVWLDTTEFARELYEEAAEHAREDEGRKRMANEQSAKQFQALREQGKAAEVEVREVAQESDKSDLEEGQPL